jgi:Rod binding domain-containing protein
MADLKLISPITSFPGPGSVTSLSKLTKDAQSADSKKINQAGQDFESVLVGQWLEQAQKSFATVPGGDPDASADPGHDQFQGIAMQALAQRLTKAGGIGIAAMLIKQLRATQSHKVNPDNNNDIAGKGTVSSQADVSKLQK